MLRLHKSTSPTLSSWSPPIDIASEAGSEFESSILFPGESTPVILSNRGSTNCWYIPAQDAEGTTWNVPEIMNIPFSSQRSTTVNDLPAFIEFKNGRDILYWQATDPSAMDWGTPVHINHQVSTTASCRMAEVDGRPAVIYYDDSKGVLIYSRASDEAGSSWPDGVTLSDSSYSVFALDIVDGRPSVFFFNRFSFRMAFVAANDASGTYWSESVEFGSQLQHDRGVIDVESIQGKPACVHASGFSNAEEFFVIMK